MFLGELGKIYTRDNLFESLDNLFFENILNSLNKVHYEEQIPIEVSTPAKRTYF